jgi:hypothetical protein
MELMTIESLAEHWDDAVIPVAETRPQTVLQKQWAVDGVVILKGLADERLMRRYEDAWLRENGGITAELGRPETYARRGGWPYATPYMNSAALLDICCDDAIAGTLEELIGEPAGVHLNLTGWVSTRRNWHFDQYLNEPYVGGFYVAMWMALDTIHPDSGPFQYVRGSHRWWPPISQARMRAALGQDGDGPDWPTHSERILTPLFEHEMQARGATVTDYLPERGDVLFWHSRLLHRGSIPADPARERRALISHYSGIHHRPDMPEALRHPSGGWFFPLGGVQPVVQPDA